MPAVHPEPPAAESCRTGAAALVLRASAPRDAAPRLAILAESRLDTASVDIPFSKEV